MVIIHKRLLQRMIKMLFDEAELKKMIANGFENITVENEIKFNILNFIQCIHLNKQNFYESSFDSKLFGDLEMTFKKDENCLIGYCRAVIKKENTIVEYLFTDVGYEEMTQVIKD